MSVGTCNGYSMQWLHANDMSTVYIVTYIYIKVVDAAISNEVLLRV